MTTQKNLRLLVPRLPGETTLNLNSRRADFNEPHTHRAPAVVTNRDSQLEEINRKLDLLAGLFSRSAVLSAVLDEAIAADEQAEKGGAL